MIFKREGTGGMFGRVKAGRMKGETLTRIMAVRRIVRSTVGCKASGYELAAACTVDGGCRKMTAGY